MRRRSSTIDGDSTLNRCGSSSQRLQWSQNSDRGLPAQNRKNRRTCEHASGLFEMCSIEQGRQVCFQRATVKVIAKGGNLDVFLLVSEVFCCGIRSPAPFCACISAPHSLRSG